VFVWYLSASIFSIPSSVMLARIGDITDIQEVLVF
jgi:hypothetical protein